VKTYNFLKQNMKQQEIKVQKILFQQVEKFSGYFYECFNNR